MLNFAVQGVLPSARLDFAFCGTRAARSPWEVWTFAIAVQRGEKLGNRRLNALYVSEILFKASEKELNSA